MDRLDEQRGKLCVIVVFRDLHVPPFGSCWVDTFRPDELVVVSPQDAASVPRSAVTRECD